MRALVVIALVAGCAREGEPVRAWTVEADGKTSATTLPGDLHDVLPARVIDYRLRTDARVTPNTPATLALECFHGALALEVDGVAVPDHGDVGVGEHRFVFVPARETVSLVLAARQDLATTNGFGTEPMIVEGALAGHGEIASFNRAADIVEVSLLGAFGFLFGAMYLLDRRRREHAALAVQAFGMIAIPLNLLGVLEPLFGPALTAVVVNACSNVVALGLLYFLHEANELGPPRRAWLWIAGGLLVAHGAVLASYRAALLLFPLQAVFTNAVLAYVVVRYIGLARDRRSRSDALLLLAGLALAAIGVGLEYVWLVTGHGLFAGVHPVGFGILPVALTQSIVLARQYVARQRALESTADELRHQVTERSRELSEALAKLSQPRVAIEAGRVIDGRYRVVRRIGAGGMGAVYEVERLADARHFALKTLRGHVEPDLMARFAREAQIAAQTSHPNLLPVLDVGVADGLLFLVMPLVAGGSLDQQRARFGDARWARPVVRQIATGLAALHERGIVHRDLKPANILLEDGVARIGDFGLAGLYDDATGATVPSASALAETAALSPPLTRAGDVFGTPAYMAPELAGGVHEIKPSSDVFAFGLIAHELLTGVTAFAEPPLVARMAGREIVMPVLDGVEPIVARCLELDPGKRPTAAEVVSALT